MPVKVKSVNETLFYLYYLCQRTPSHCLYSVNWGIRHVTTQSKAGTIEKSTASSPKPLSDVLTTGPDSMFSGNGTTDNNIEAHTLDASKSSATGQGPTASTP